MDIKNKNGFTFIDVIVGTVLMLIVFSGIFGAFQLGLKVVSQSRNKITSTAIANQQLEMIRNLSYLSVGTKDAILPYAEGVLDSATTTEVNDVEYGIETRVKFISDGADGTGAGDSCDLDYKRAEVKVSWAGRFGGEVKLATDLAPKNKVEEISACTAQPGGILSVKAFDAFGVMISSPLIEIFNPGTGGLIDSVIPLSGEYDFPLATSGYRVVVSKSGYSTDRSYGIDEVYNGQTIATPEKSHPIVLDGQITETSFSIDAVSAFSIDTLSPWGIDYFSDGFVNSSKVFQSSDVLIQEGEVNLATDSEGYLSPGSLTSVDISPTNIIQWDEFTFTDLEPVDTDLKYQIRYASGTDWYLIPEADLPGNSAGFDLPPVDVSGLNIAIYFQLRLQANLSTDSAIATPVLQDWQVSWITSLAAPIPNAVFGLEGAKAVGQDSAENPIYKYSAAHSSDAGGHIDISNLEWDAYTFSVNPATGLDLIDIDPFPQPIGLNPDATSEVDLYLDAENSLLATVQNINTLEPVFGATVRLYNVALAYDTAQYTDAKGQTYFIPLEAATYNLEASSPGYLSLSTTTSVSGDNTKIIKLEQIE